MTPRTKRRLAVLALALGLIAAAPQLFYSVAERLRGERFLCGARTANFAAYGSHWPTAGRWLEVSVGPSSVAFVSFPQYCRLSWNISLGRGGGISLPGESITLRVACAVVLAGVWGLVVGGRALVRRYASNRRTVELP